MRPRLRLHGMDGMRAMAALAIVVLHVYGYTALATMGDAPRSEYAGVVGRWFDTAVLQSAIRTNVFFVLSGLLLSLPFIRWMLLPDTERRPSARRFVRNRVRRIWPLYLFILLFSAATITSQYAGIRNVVLNALLVENIVPDTPRIVPVSWTLSVELGFYVLLPIAAYAVAPLVRARRSLRTRLVLTSLLPLAGFWVGWVTRSHPRLHITSIPGFDIPPTTTVAGHADDFGAGILAGIIIVATLASHGRLAARIRQLPALAWTLPGTALVLVGLVARWRGLQAAQPNEDLHAWWASIAAVGIAMWLLAVALRPDTSWLGRVAASPAMTSLGLRSYGIFLWHFAVIRILRQYDLIAAGGIPAVALNLLTVLAITLPLSWVTWHLIERPFLEGRVTLPRLRPRWRSFLAAPRNTRPGMLVRTEAGDAREW